MLRRARLQPPSACFLLALLLLVGPASVAAAQATLSKSLYRALDAVRTQLQEGRPKQALEQLNRAKQQARDDYSKAVVAQTYGYIWLELDKPRAAADAFRRALELDALPDSAQNNMRYNLAGVLSRLGETAAAVKLLEAYLETETDPPIQANTLLARLYLDQEKYQAAARLLEQVRAELDGPDETVLLLLVSAYSEGKQLRRTPPLLRDLIRLSPGRAAYWQQLAATLLALKRDKQALAVLESAWLNGLLEKPNQLRYLAQLYIQQGVPYKAGRLLEKEPALKSDPAARRLSAQAWQTARERAKAIAVLEAAAAESPDPDTYQQLAQLYFSGEDWDDAERALQRGIKAASGENRDRMLLSLGVVRYRQRRAEQARTAFEQALEGPDTRNQAEQWIRYLDYLETADSRG